MILLIGLWNNKKSLRNGMKKMNKRKVIFLDIDGVLNSDEYFDKTIDLKIQGIESEVDVEKIKLLN